MYYFPYYSYTTQDKNLRFSKTVSSINLHTLDSMKVSTEDRQRFIWNEMVPPAMYHPFWCWLASPLGFTMLPTTTIQPTTHQPTNPTTSITRTPSSSWGALTSKKQTAPKPRDLKLYSLLCFSSSILVLATNP